MPDHLIGSERISTPTSGVGAPTGEASNPARRRETAPELPAINGYELTGVLGQGGMGVVYKARHLKLDRIVALKVIRPELLAHPGSLDRFQREARAASKLTHPNLVTIYDAAESEGLHYLAMEFVEGMDLAHLVREKGPQPVAVACDYIRQAALGLQHAHECGLVHRDIKPGNLLWTPKEGRIKLVDLGLALLQGSVENHETTGELTHTGALMGTPDFIAPEQVRDCHSVDIRADLYSLGCTLYYLLAGRVPFPGGAMIDKLDKHRFESPQSIDCVRGDVPVAVADILRKLMAKRPEDRYQTPAQLAEALLPFCPSDNIALQALASDPQAKPTPPRTDASHGSRRRRMLGPIAAIVAIFGGLGLYAVIHGINADPNTQGQDDQPTEPIPVAQKLDPLEVEKDQRRVNQDPAANANTDAAKKSEPVVVPAPKVGPIHLFWSTGPTVSDTRIAQLNLRPNVEQMFFLFADNQGDEIKHVTAELIAGEKPIENAKVVIPSLAKGTQLIRFPQLGPPSNKAPAWIELPQDSARIALYIDRAKPIEATQVRVGRPNQYIDSQVVEFDPKRKRISALVRAIQGFSGPRCAVELDLRPERIPFLAPIQKRDGSYGGYVQRPGEQVELEANNLQMQSNPGTGWVYLKVDGYERAFTYRISSDGGLPTALEAAAIRLSAERAVASGAPIKVQLETDNLPDSSVLEVGLYRDNKFLRLDGDLLHFKGDRRVRIQFQPAQSEGGLVFRTEVTDWKAEFGTTKLYGQRFLRARLVDALSNQPLEFMGMAPGISGRVNEIMFALIIDGSPPEDVTWVEHNLDQLRQAGNRSVRVAAKGIDPESGIQKVIFFMGKPNSEKNAIPPGVATAVGMKIKDKDVWEATLPLPSNSQDDLDVSVQFTNGAGLSTISTTKVVKGDHK